MSARNPDHLGVTAKRRRAVGKRTEAHRYAAVFCITDLFWHVILFTHRMFARRQRGSAGSHRDLLSMHFNEIVKCVTDLLSFRMLYLLVFNFTGVFFFLLMERFLPLFRPKQHETSFLPERAYRGGCFFHLFSFSMAAISGSYVD